MLSIFLEVEPTVNELPRKRHCSGAVDDSRPFLDLEKMRDQVNRLAFSHVLHIVPFSWILGYVILNCHH